MVIILLADLHSILIKEIKKNEKPYQEIGAPPESGAHSPMLYLLQRCWTGVLRRFLTSKKIGVASEDHPRSFDGALYAFGSARVATPFGGVECNFNIV